MFENGKARFFCLQLRRAGALRRRRQLQHLMVGQRHRRQPEALAGRRQQLRQLAEELVRQALLVVAAQLRPERRAGNS